jgi:hypothetical protein
MGSHKYKHSGTYIVRIAITGKKGNVTTTTSKIVVLAPPNHVPTHTGKKGGKH